MSPGVKLFTLLLLGVVVSGDSSVHIQSEYQLVTSSTLRWVSKRGGQRSANTVLLNQEGSNKFYVCRARHHGLLAVGKLNEEYCQVGFLQKVRNMDSYEVLENVDNSSRLQWSEWDLHTKRKIPMGSVAVRDNVFIGRYQGEDGVSYVGSLDSTNTFAKLVAYTEEGERQEYIRGEILYEMEPVSYKLHDVKLNEKRSKVIKEKLILAETVLSNEDGFAETQVEQMLFYKYEYYLYWGQVKGTVKALQTAVVLPDGSSEKMKWGIAISDNRQEGIAVSARLLPGAAVNLTVDGEKIVEEAPYTAKLTSLYEDGMTMTHTIEGIMQRTSLRDVTVKHGPHYFARNGTLVPTTTTTTTTTTQPPTTTTTPPQPKADSSSEDTVSDEPLENHKRRDSGMMADEAKDKGDGGRSAGSWRSSSDSPHTGIHGLWLLLLLYTLL